MLTASSQSQFAGLLALEMEIILAPFACTSPNRALLLTAAVARVLLAQGHTPILFTHSPSALTDFPLNFTC